MGIVWGNLGLLIGVGIVCAGFAGLGAVMTMRALRQMKANGEWKCLEAELKSQANETKPVAPVAGVPEIRH